MTAKEYLLGSIASIVLIVLIILLSTVVRAEDERLTECLCTTDDKCACLVIKNRSASEACYDAKKKETP